MVGTEGTEAPAGAVEAAVAARAGMRMAFIPRVVPWTTTACHSRAARAAALDLAGSPLARLRTEGQARRVLWKGF